MNAAFLTQNAVAEFSGAARISTEEARPGSRFANNKGVTVETDLNAALEALIKEDQERRANAEKAAGKTDAAKGAP